MDRYDTYKSYCRMLGHDVPFSYCRTVNNDLPCGKVLDCWFEMIDVESYIIDVYDEKEREKIFSPPVQKISSLIYLIEKAKKP